MITKKSFLYFFIVLIAIGLISCCKVEENDYRDKWTGEYTYKALVIWDVLETPFYEQWEGCLHVEKTGPTEINIFISNPEYYHESEHKVTFTVKPDGKFQLINVFDPRTYVSGGFTSKGLVFSYRDHMAPDVTDYSYVCFKK